MILSNPSTPDHGGGVEGELLGAPAQGWHPALLAVFGTLEAAAVRWSVLRPPSDPSAPTGDVDLLVHRGDRGRLAAVLGPLGFSRMPDGGSADLFFLRYEPVTDLWLLLQFTCEIAFGPRLALRTGAAEPALARRIRRDDTCWYLRPEDELWATVAHAALDKGGDTERYRPRLTELARTARSDGPVRDALAPHFPVGWNADKVLASVRDGAWADVESFSRQLAERWVPRRGAPAARSRIAGILRLARGLANPWRRRGVSVALLGPDGAGKSTLAEGLEQHFFLGSRAFYMDVRDNELARIAALRVPGLTFVAFLGTLWLRLARARVHQAHGELVVFDRYMYDVLADVDRPGRTRAEALARWAHTHLLPDTAVGVVLDVPGERMFARKGERTARDLEAERQRWLALARTLPNMVVVDASRSPRDVRREVTGIVWAQYARRWDRAPRRRRGKRAGG